MGTIAVAMGKVDAFDIIDIFGISQQEADVTTNIENGRAICKINAWHPSGPTLNKKVNLKPWISMSGKTYKDQCVSSQQSSLLK